jgi:mRNA export factor
MDVAYPLLVVGTAERHISIFNLTNPTAPYKTIVSPLKWQTRTVSCFPSSNGFAVGSVEGRVAIQ